MSDSLTTIYIEPDQCPSHHAILLTQGQICEIFMKKFWELAILKNGHFWKTAILDFFFKKKIFFCFILMKISPNLYGRMHGLKFWCFPWFPENSFLCVILRYTVYVHYVNSSVPKFDMIHSFCYQFLPTPQLHCKIEVPYSNFQFSEVNSLFPSVQCLIFHFSCFLS